MDSPLFWLLVALSVPTTSMARNGIAYMRSSMQLTDMLKRTTGRSVSYFGYGCYCGPGGKGWPRDGTDWCCFKHDCCYRRAEADNCSPKSHTYIWNDVSDGPRCDEDNTRCQMLNCECDVKLSKCLMKKVYNWRYALYPNFLCGNSVPCCKALGGKNQCLL